MTTLVALATKDCLVFGCDSLGSSIRKFIDPLEVFQFFDSNKNYQLKCDDTGEPILKNVDDILKKVVDVPYTHMPHITKLFELKPFEMALMMTGISAIGKRTIKSLVEEFIRSDDMFNKSSKRKNYSVETIAYKFKDFIQEYYESEFKSEKPSLEFLFGGYDKRKALPKIFRIQFPDNKIHEECKDGEFGIVLGGQTKEIQRLIFGTDAFNRYLMKLRHYEKLREYRNWCNELLKDSDIKFEIPELDAKEIESFDIFADDWKLQEFKANWGDFSEQNAIECVNFFVNVMIRSQQFCEGMPTVGGAVHIALITKSKGVKFISKEQYEHEGHIVSKII